jgi:hypothetical protein
MSSTIKFRCLDNSGNNIFLIDSLQGVYSTNTTDSTNTSTGSVLLYGGLSINKTSNSISVSQGGALTIAGGASIGKDVYIGGNLTVYGTQTQFISQTLNVSDNLIIVNSSPVSGRDAGVLFHRFQTENNSNVGDIVADNPTFSTIISNRTSNTIVFDTAANSSDNYYTNWYIKITNGPGISQVRRITNYIGSTRTATINTNWNVLPSIGNSVSFYNKIYASQYYRESSDNFVLAYTTNDSSSTVEISDYVGLHAGYINIFNTDNSIGIGSGGSFTTLGGVSIAKDMYIGGNLNVLTNISTNNVITTNISSSTLISSHLTTGSAQITNLNAVTITTGILSLPDINATSGIVFRSGASRIYDDGQLRLYTDDHMYFYTDNTTSSRMHINGSGYVGVGKENPTSRLDVEFSGIASGQSILSLHGTNTGINDYNLIEGGHGSGSFFIVKSNGDVGIGTSTPSFKLDVVGTAKISTGLTTGSLKVTGLGDVTNLITTTATFPNVTVTNMSVGVINVSTGLTSATILATHSSIGNLNVTGITAGNINFTGNLYQNSGLYISSQWTSGSNGNLTYTNGNVGIGTTAPGVSLQVHSTAISSLRVTSDNPFVAGLEIDSTNKIGGKLWRVISTHDAATEGTGKLIIQQVTDSTNVFTINSSGNIGIGTINPSHQLHIAGTQFVSSTQGLGNNNPTTVSGGALNVSGDIVISGTRGIHFTSHGVGIPSTTNRSLGTKIILYPSLSSSILDYAIGIEDRNVWFSVDSNESGFKWYQGSQATMSLQTRGNLVLHSTTNASGVGTGGALTILGGASFSKNVYVGENLYVNGQNLTSISGSTTIGNYTGTGIFEITGIAIGKTMANLNYKINGNLNTSTNNTNIYTVTFKNLTTSTFDAVIYRIDSLGSGWTDTNLKLSWYITP